jgi:hypothetical protein
MSSILVDEKKFFFSIKIFFLFFFSIIFLRVFFIYEGNKSVYLLFSILSLYLIYFSFRKKSLFYETFFGIFLFLGFWFKFSIIIFFNLGFREGVNNLNLNSNFDYPLLISVVGFLGFLVAGHLREIFFFYPKKININYENNFYLKYRKIILIIFFISIIITCFLNFYFRIYQRGFIGQSYNIFITGFVRTALLYGFSLCSAIILFLELLTYRKIFLSTIFIVLLESFLSSLSMLSRGMIFNIGSLFYGLYKISDNIKKKIKLDLNFFFKIFLIIFIFFYISVNLINYARIKFLDLSLNLEKINSISDFESYPIKEHVSLNTNSYFKEFNNLLIHRWVGIDSVLVVSNNKTILNFDFLKSSLNEKFSLKSHSFYETSFNLKSGDIYKLSSLYKGNTLPGLIAFLFYSGSFFFLFFSMILISFFASSIEFLSFKLLNYNLLFSAIIGQVIAYRLVHFGYLPSQSYLLFGSIIVIIITFYCIKKIFINFNTNKT